jgi:hypothetical protein
MNKQNSRKKQLRSLLALIMLTGSIGVVASYMLIPGKAVAADVVVYKSPTCGCCRKWVSHMRENGFSVEVHEQYNVTPIKDQYGVPKRLRSCHTAKVGGYVIEGHVPADVVKQLLEGKPVIAGVAVPGMPMGSPGMEGHRKDAYDVIGFSENGKTGVFASR